MATMESFRSIGKCEPANGLRILDGHLYVDDPASRTDRDLRSGQVQRVEGPHLAMTMATGVDHSQLEHSTRCWTRFVPR